MDLGRHLRYFLVVAREGHFGEAAVELGIAQPALSQSVRRLEEELGVALFDRSRRRVELTPAGRLLVSQARDLVAGETRLRETMRRVRDGELGTLRAAVPPATPAVALRGLVEQMADQAPGLEVDLCEMAGTELVRALGEGSVDTGLLTAPFEGAGLLGQPVHRAQLGAVLPRGEALARADSVDLGDLAGRDLVLPARRNAPVWFERVLAVCRESGWIPPRVREAGDTEFLLGLVLVRRGVALETAAVAAREPRLAWRPLTGAPLHRRTEAVRPAQDAHPAAVAFAEAAARVLARPPANGGSLTVGGGHRPWSRVYGEGPITLPG
ncbi:MULTISPECIES: LysR family transcriptional regulator [Nocardiopsis]|uniref:DNA-binding transcriptional LysR family regulator n=1 Tax=Nocardiopsis sinuspersici TaxID=501010 RepID=A0A1V3BZ16_9ACTN|nr:MULTISPECIES: LysR family transcriptional regulator [Nocardiopsis]NYH55071.1 DNA-binding transcriptional LysR family regulator [Nocardiopsis sinuspersici]OOC53787.1 LysR family transcriptional regulator [Nocardiopsis sinuspersici]